jgi:hypothetical protein
MRYKIGQLLKTPLQFGKKEGLVKYTRGGGFPKWGTKLVGHFGGNGAYKKKPKNLDLSISMATPRYRKKLTFLSGGCCSIGGVTQKIYLSKESNKRSQSLVFSRVKSIQVGWGGRRSFLAQKNTR